jgi:putative flippase GtrA
VRAIERLIQRGDLGRASRFAVVGVFVTASHIVTATALMGLVLLEPGAANAIAFSIATAISYTVNTLWSFSKRHDGKQLMRFLLVSTFGGALAAIVAHSFALLGYSNLVATLAVVLLVPATTFVLHNHWTYR